MNPNDDLDIIAAPHAAEAEAALLSATLLDSRAAAEIVDLVEASDIYHREHRLVFGAAAELINSGQPVDVITVFEELQRQGKADEVGGLPYLNSLAQYVPTASNIRRYAELVRERSVLRALAQAGGQIRGLALAPTADAGAAVDAAQGLLQRIELGRRTSEPVRAGELVAGMLSRIDEVAHGRQIPGVPTGFQSLDRILNGGFKPGQHIVLAARPGIGKSSLAATLCLRAAEAGHAAAVFSLEMGRDELIDRLAANIAQVDLSRMAVGRLDTDEWTRLRKAADHIRTLPLYLEDQPALTLGDVRAKARRLVRNHGVRLVVVDYLQLMSGGVGSERLSRHHQIEPISRGLKALAKELAISTLVLSQLNRDVENRPSGRPRASDLRESGSLEEDADVVLLLSRDSLRDDDIAVVRAEIPKCRGGRSGSFLKLAFDGRHQRWAEMSGEQAPQKRKSTAFE